mgnify:CR=1 FL=1
MIFRFLRFCILISFLLIKPAFVFSNDSNEDSNKLVSEKRTENNSNDLKNTRPKSRLIKPNSKNNINTTIQDKKNEVDENFDAKVNKVKDGSNESEKKDNQIIIIDKSINEKIIEEKDEKNKASQKEKKIKIFYLPDSSDIDDVTLKKFYTNIRKIDKNYRVTLRSYSSKSKERTTSFARRLSLTRALKVRNILLEEGFLNTKVFVKALGAENSNQESQDVLILDID